MISTALTRTAFNPPTIGRVSSTRRNGWPLQKLTSPQPQSLPSRPSHDLPPSLSMTQNEVNNFFHDATTSLIITSSETTTATSAGDPIPTGITPIPQFEPVINLPATLSFLTITVIFTLLQIRINAVSSAARRRSQSLEKLRKIESLQLSASDVGIDARDRPTSEMVEEAKREYEEALRRELDLRTIVPGVRIVEGVFVYQAFNHEIADWALTHQKFGGQNFNPTRMTWFKPSLAWMLYRAGYGRKSNQQKILKIKLSHEDLATILSQCYCTIHGEKGRKMKGEGRVQWDPSRDLYSAKNGVPRKMSGLRAIQIGVSGSLSEFYAGSPLSIEDVTELAHRVAEAHGQAPPKIVKDMMNELDLPEERTYYPRCEREVLIRLGMIPGETAKSIAQIGIPSPMKKL